MSERYDYETAMVEDIKQWLDDTGEYEDGILSSDREDIYEKLWVADSVTGSASGSYYCNAWKAEEAICHNLNLMGEACEEFGCKASDLAEKGAEWADVTIRCYLLGQVLDRVIDEWNEAHEPGEDEI